MPSEPLLIGVWDSVFLFKISGKFKTSYQHRASGSLLDTSLISDLNKKNSISAFTGKITAEKLYFKIIRNGKLHPFSLFLSEVLFYFFIRLGKTGKWREISILKFKFYSIFQMEDRFHFLRYLFIHLKNIDSRI